MSSGLEASVAISKGVRPISNGGWLSITDGRVQLYDGKGELLGDEPAANVWAKGRLGTMGSGVSLWLGAEKYMVSPGSGQPPALPLIRSGTAVGVNVVAHGRKFAKQLYAVLEAEGGHLGAP